MHSEHDQSQPYPFADDAADISAGEKNRTEEKQVVALQAELSQVRDRWMRAEAEIANVRTRAKRDVEEAKLFAVQKFAGDVAEATENLRRGIDTLPAASRDEPEIIGRLRDGLLGIDRSILAILERNGIERRDPTGSAFDPNLHQAMAEQQDAGHPPGTVLQAWTPVWTINGRLLRPAMVVVSKASSPEAEPPQSEED